MAQQGQNVAAQAAGAGGGPGNRTPDKVLELLNAEAAISNEKKIVESI
jgi:hypothetical protein